MRSFTMTRVIGFARKALLYGVSFKKPSLFSKSPTYLTFTRINNTILILPVFNRKFIAGFNHFLLYQSSDRHTNNIFHEMELITFFDFYKFLYRYLSNILFYSYLLPKMLVKLKKIKRELFPKNN